MHGRCGDTGTDLSRAGSGQGQHESGSMAPMSWAPPWEQAASAGPCCRHPIPARQAPAPPPRRTVQSSPSAGNMK